MPSTTDAQPAVSSNKRYSPREEVANAITHGIGTLLAIAGLVLLTLAGAHAGSGWTVVSGVLFGATLVLSYLSSTLYHAIPGPRIKKVLQIFDHSAILLLIAGTYTPFTLISLHGPWGWTLFATVWTLALIGIAFEMTSLRRHRRLLIGLYLIMGWTVITAIKPLLANLSAQGFQLLLVGGLAYTVGVLFYLWRWLPFNHAVWHCFVLAGSCCHFFAVLFYVLPAAH
jgi:hemolysin III